MEELVVPNKELIGPDGQPLGQVPTDPTDLVTLPNGDKVPAPKTGAERRTIQQRIQFLNGYPTRAEVEGQIIPEILKVVDVRIDAVAKYLLNHFDMIPRTEAGAALLAQIRPQVPAQPAPLPWWKRLLQRLRKGGGGR